MPHVTTTETLFKIKHYQLFAYLLKNERCQIKALSYFPHVVKWKGKKSKGNSPSSVSSGILEIMVNYLKYAFFPMKDTNTFYEAGRILKTAAYMKY